MITLIGNRILEIMRVQLMHQKELLFDYIIASTSNKYVQENLDNIHNIINVEITIPLTKMALISSLPPADSELLFRLKTRETDHE